MRQAGTQGRHSSAAEDSPSERHAADGGGADPGHANKFRRDRHGAGAATPRDGASSRGYAGRARYDHAANRVSGPYAV